MKTMMRIKITNGDLEVIYPLGLRRIIDFLVDGIDSSEKITKALNEKVIREKLGM